MSTLKWVSGLVAAAAIIAGGAASAHHAFSAEFDAKQPVQISGVVTKTRWVNPHSWIYLDVKGDDGSVTNWGFEFGSVSALERVGLTKSALPPGTPLTIKGYRSRNGGPFGYTVTATLSDGRKFQLGAAQDGAPPEPETGASK
ncbi:MAG: DUF6152 family protein [Steroidobacteraceae bacterium]